MENNNPQVEIAITNEMDAVETSMRKKLSSKRYLDPKRCIYKVPEFIKKGKEECYRPRIVSIGPAYYKDSKLQSMQQYKWNFLDSFLQHPKNACRSLDCYINIVRELKEDIRDCYDETLMKSCDDDDEFIEVMVLDAVFLLSILLVYCGDYDVNFDPANKLKVVMLYMRRDMFLEENQLPFFVLQRIFDLAFHTQPMSLVDLVHRFICVEGHTPRSDYIATAGIGDASKITHLIDFWRERYFSFRTQRREQKPVEFPRTAKELRAAGVKFRKSESLSPLRIEFDRDNGELRIPLITVDENTEAFLRNLLHFEQCHYFFTDQACFIDLLFFLDSLIDTAEDIQLLERKGILKNVLGSDEKAANLFNNITTDVRTKVDFNHLRGISKDVNEYANKSWNRWMAILRRDYFRHPWAILSFIFAILLFILTVLQTITGFTKN